MRIILNDGREFQGTALQIVNQMRSLAFGRGGRDVAEYAAWVADNAQRGDGVALNVTGATEDERAASLLDELVRTGLARSEPLARAVRAFRRGLRPERRDDGKGSNPTHRKQRLPGDG